MDWRKVSIIIGFLTIGFSGITKPILNYLFINKSNDGLQQFGIFFSIYGLLMLSSNLGGWKPEEILLKYSNENKISEKAFVYALRKNIIFSFLIYFLCIIILYYYIPELSTDIHLNLLNILIISLIPTLNIWNNFLSGILMVKDKHNFVYLNKLILAYIPIICVIFIENIDVWSIFKKITFALLIWALIYYVLAKKKLELYDFNIDIKKLKVDSYMSFSNGIIKSISNKAEYLIFPIVLGTKIFGAYIGVISYFGLTLMLTNPLNQYYSLRLYSKTYNKRSQFKKILFINIITSVIMCVLLIVLNHIEWNIPFIKEFHINIISLGFNPVLIGLIIWARGQRWYVRSLGFGIKSSHNILINLIYIFSMILISLFTMNLKFIEYFTLLEILLTIYWYLWTAKKLQF